MSSSSNKNIEKKPAFSSDFPRFTRVMLWINGMGLLLGLVLIGLDLGEGQGIAALKKLPLLLAFVMNSWMNWQALKHKR